MKLRLLSKNSGIRTAQLIEVNKNNGYELNFNTEYDMVNDKLLVTILNTTIILSVLVLKIIL